MTGPADTRAAERQRAGARSGRAATPSSLDELLLLVGQMNLSWTNTESLLIHLIAGLANVSKEVATVIFLTLNTTRARLDIVSRLSKLDGVGATTRTELLSIIASFTRLAKVRNKYNHCIYAFDDRLGSVDTIQLRILEQKTSLRYGKREAVDAGQLDRIRATISGIEALNLEIRRVILASGYPA
jgi:hypothetical protein